ncbi:hypothetical protein A7S96_14000 [Salmonella enterica subsp. diarizonae serovar 60:r:e,n,x,z15]|nr:hypothetical protein A7S96_14000 [Salmonella enterica subsp. diarizonae serovar 60:r:e,n,x,z15]OHJ81556.1 hypothetical protein A7S58_15265 [Salmonella enterica]OHF67169.1 hypothetical protein A7T04_15245 [Salmonella enterica subsp. diarizonae serovar 60:r:e,n,x,z15]OHF72791.1 hypothetical protein A7T09_15265 [Salmonella enterica subsp. diarizonae serovar 60:r:e,n,x,z15]OHF77534.1 hypothetical protein A7T26_15265 [Salmonella enterica subsp. diarizonae serovar 60:r:e,n,x,z15]
MSEKITLTVFKNSPQIWRGGLSDCELADWLICRANAILWQFSFGKELEEIRDKLAEKQAHALLIKDYANLGISSAESDSIQPLSREAIQFSGLQASFVIDGVCKEGIPIPPVGYTVIPELGAALQGIQQRKTAVLEQLASQYGKIPTPTPRRCLAECDFADRLFEDHR